MKSCKVNAGLLGLLLMGVVHQADAAIHTWSFETTDIFAFLDFNDVTSDFTIRDNNANNLLAPNAGVNGIAFDFNGVFPTNTAIATSSIAIGNLDPSTTNPALIAGFDVGFIGQSNKSADEINDGESTTFNFGAISLSAIDGVALRFNDNNGNINGESNWITGAVVTAVPEPETYAMFLAGLGLLGFAARRNVKR